LRLSASAKAWSRLFDIGLLSWALLRKRCDCVIIFGSDLSSRMRLFCRCEFLETIDRKVLYPLSPGALRGAGRRVVLNPRFRMLCLPVAVAVGVRVLGAFWLLRALTVNGRFETPWMKANPGLIPSDQSWLWLFNAFDSLHFTLIAVHGYARPEYAYLPGFPILIFLAGRLFGYWFGAFVVTQLFAMGSILVFQMVAEHYLSPRESLHATLLMSAFPFISVFMTLGYSEPIFLFSTLLAWYFYKKAKIMPASLAAAFAAVTRGYGVLIVLPMVLGLIRSKRYNKVAYPLIIPTTFIGAWLLFCYISVGDAFASWTDQKYWQHGGVGDGIKIAQSFLHDGLRGLINCCSGLDPTIFWALGVFAILIALTWEVDHLLFIYAAGVSGLLLLVTTYSLSLLRFFPFIFPIWVSLRVKNPVIVAICVGLLIPMTIVLWLYTVAVTFTG